MNSPKICLVGTRGIPARYGGFETFAEEISTLLAASGLEVAVQCEPGNEKISIYKGVSLFFSSVKKSGHPLKYFYEGISWGVKNCDIIIVASTAGSIFYWLNTFRRRTIITNPDGLEHKRRKWSLPKRAYLKLSEMMACRLSDYLVADSDAIRSYLNDKYGLTDKKIRVIEYGAYENLYCDDGVLADYRLVRNNYFLVVSRLEPENNIEMIIEGYTGAATVSPLVIVGNILDNRYVKSLVNRYSSDRIRFIGGIYDRQELNALRFACKAYIHGHSVGGTNPSLLEAMGSHNLILAHDNKFNREVTGNSQLYFSSAEQCRKNINEIELMSSGEIQKLKDDGHRLISEKYNWDNVLRKYLDLISAIEARNGGNT